MNFYYYYFLINEVYKKNQNDKYKYPYCTKEYKFRGSLTHHFQDNHNKMKKCRIRGKRVKRINDHLKICAQGASNIKKFKYFKCNKLYFEKKKLNRHIEEAHIKKNICNFCGENYIRKRDHLQSCGSADKETLSKQMANNNKNNIIDIGKDYHLPLNNMIQINDIFYFKNFFLGRGNFSDTYYFYSKSNKIEYV